ncbi:hypothetical protein A2U01_0073119, partial [Trifolium medium]|nr:hypothetical protein [Trifolium medium]
MWDMEYELHHLEQDQEAQTADFARRLEVDLMEPFITAPGGSSSQGGA